MQPNDLIDLMYEKCEAGKYRQATNLWETKGARFLPILNARNKHQLFILVSAAYTSLEQIDPALHYNKQLLELYEHGHIAPDDAIYQDILATRIRLLIKNNRQAEAAVIMKQYLRMGGRRKNVLNYYYRHRAMYLMPAFDKLLWILWGIETTSFIIRKVAGIHLPSEMTVIYGVFLVLNSAFLISYKLRFKALYFLLRLPAELRIAYSA